MQYAQKLAELEASFDDLSVQMSDPALIGDQAEYTKVAKRHRDLEEVVTKYREWKQVNENIHQARQMMLEGDADIREMATEEAAELEPRLGEIENELKLLLLPKDPNDERNVVLEIRAGTGGDEATLFAGEIFRMYTRYAEERRWKVAFRHPRECADLRGFGHPRIETA